MIVKGHRIAGSGRPVVMVTMSVDEALHVGMELGDDGRQIFDAAWDLLPDDAPERVEYDRLNASSINTKSVTQ